MTQPNDITKKDEIIQILRRIAGELKTDSVARDEFHQNSGFSRRVIQRLFGSYNDLVKAAGLVPLGSMRVPGTEAPSHSKAEIIQTLCRIAGELKTDSVSRDEFYRLSGLTRRTVQRLFGSYIHLVKAAGLVPMRFESTEISSHSKAEIIQTLCRIAGELKTDSVARDEFYRRSRRSGLTRRMVQRLFGSYNDLVRAAGLVPKRFPSTEAPSYSKEEIIQEIVRIAASKLEAHDNLL